MSGIPSPFRRGDKQEPIIPFMMYVGMLEEHFKMTHGLNTNDWKILNWMYGKQLYNYYVSRKDFDDEERWYKWDPKRFQKYCDMRIIFWWNEDGWSPRTGVKKYRFTKGWMDRMNYYYHVALGAKRFAETTQNNVVLRHKYKGPAMENMLHDSEHFEELRTAKELRIAELEAEEDLIVLEIEFKRKEIVIEKKADNIGRVESLYAEIEFLKKRANQVATQLSRARRS